MSSFTVKIGGADLPVGVKVASESLSINYDQSGTRGVCSFTLIDKNLSGTLFYFTSVSGKSIEVYKGATLIYGGKIDSPKTRKINMKPMISQEITCVDHHEICDRIKVNQSYPKYTIDELIKTIIDDYLATDGITYDSGSIQTTTTTISINCPYISCSDIFDEIVEYIGWQWYIGPDKKFYFNDRTANIGPALNEAYNYLVDSLELDDDMSEYYNTNVLTDVHAITDELTETANPNPDDNKSYYVRFKLNNKPKIYITTADNRDDPLESELVDPHYIGINGIDTDMYWYWSKNENIVTMDSELTETLTEGQYVVLKYYGQYQLDVVETNATEIAARQAIEGGSGVYYNVESGANIEGLAIAEDKAQAMLNRYAKVAKKIKVSSYNHVWENGQICDVILPSFNINSLVASGDGYLVTGLKITDKGTQLLYEVTLIDGEAIGGWVKFFKKWMNKQITEILIREDALVEIDEAVDEPIEWNGEIEIKVLDCLYPSNSLYPSNYLYPGKINDSIYASDQDYSKLSLTPTADAYVYSYNPTTNYNTTTLLVYNGG